MSYRFGLVDSVGKINYSEYSRRMKTPIKESDKKVKFL